MTGDISLFIDFKAKKKGYVTYGDNNKGAILGKGSVGNPSTTTISDVHLVEGLKHNLLSISQLCDKGYKVSFTKTCCIIEHAEQNIVFKGVRVNNIISVYLLLKNLSMYLLMSLIRKVSEKVFLLMTQVHLLKTYSKVASRGLINPT